MAEIKYRRITDCNCTIEGLERHTSFEAGFYLSEEKIPVIRGKLIDSNGVEILCSVDPQQSYPFSTEFYRGWNPSDALAKMIEAVESDFPDKEPVEFVTPLLCLSFDIRGPIGTPDMFGVIVNMSLMVTLMGSYHWKDSGYISVGILCMREPLLAFLKGLQDDYSKLIEEAGLAQR